MDKRSFTAVEILITVVILAILASISLAAGSSVASNAEQRICEQNQLIISESLAIFIRETKSVPTSLSQLAPYTDTAIARLKEQHPNQMKLRKIYLALIKASGAKEALAETYSTGDFSRHMKDRAVFQCPGKKDAGRSYGLNSDVAEATSPRAALQALNQLKGTDSPIICDCNADKFTVSGGNVSGVDFRHKRLFKEPVAIAVGHKWTWTVSAQRNLDDPVKKRKRSRRGDDNSGGDNGNGKNGHGHGHGQQQGH